MLLLQSKDVRRVFIFHRSRLFCSISHFARWLQATSLWAQLAELTLSTSLSLALSYSVALCVPPSPSVSSRARILTAQSVRTVFNKEMCASWQDEMKEKAKLEEEKKDEEKEDPKGIPEFWLTVFKNVDLLSDMLQVAEGGWVAKWVR